MSLCFVTGCRQETKEIPRKLQFEAFVPVYNRYIETWLKTQQTETEKEIEKVTTDLTTAEGDAKTALETKAKALLLDQEKYRFRIGIGPYLKFGNPSEIPTDLVWENGMDQPEIGDPRAKKGGAFRKFVSDFPPTIRPIGNNSNSSFRGDLYDLIDMKLITLHPKTMEIIPGIAKEWAVSADKRTVYFRIDPEAKYSDGHPVRARDYLISVYIRVSDNLVNPYQKQYFREEVAQVAAYDDLTLSVSLPEPKYFGPIIAGGLTPSSPIFYSEYGPDYVDRYQWRFPPTTGAYEVRTEDIIKGVSISQTRVKNWWAKDRKYYRYCFNPDKLIHTVVRDESKAFELFRAGEIDTALVTSPELWYEKCEIPPVHNGYIERATFYKQYPLIPRGLYLNVRKPPLDNRDVRIGISHAVNWQKIIDVIFRGDYQRLNAFNAGFGSLSDPSIQARRYSIDEARASFAKAGYVTEDSDGTLKKEDGTRLTVSLTYPKMPFLDRMLVIIKDEAKSCGLELRLDATEATVAYKNKCKNSMRLPLVLGTQILQLPISTSSCTPRTLSMRREIRNRIPITPLSGCVKTPTSSAKQFVMRLLKKTCVMPCGNSKTSSMMKQSSFPDTRLTSSASLHGAG
ncbi:MAG: hypothetical protein HC845_02765 [Akkermansiaceae bacterium]|nr:hypothetical protein [Akkermansiaceae bacterium]